MSLLADIDKYSKEDSRPVTEQLAYIKKLGAVMLFSPRLYKDHVIAFCGTLIKLYDNLNRETNNE